MCTVSLKQNLRINLEENILTVDDFPNICRMCFRRNDLQRFDEIFVENLSLADIFLQVTSTQENENFPNQICTDCLTKLAQVYLFIEQIKQHDSILQTVIQLESSVLVCNSETEEDEKCNTSNENVKCRDMEFVNDCNILKNSELKNILNKTSVGNNGIKKTLNGESVEVNQTKNMKNQENVKGKIKTNKKMYQCELCPKKFSLQRNLSRHKGIHRGVRYKCPLCDKVFTRSATRNEHIRIHTGEKSCICSICGKGFTYANNYYQHMLRHKHLPGKTDKPKHYLHCEICNKLLLSKSSLKIHMLTHTGDKTNLCNICGKAFTTKAAFQSHMRIHTGERPYTCDICCKKFSHSSSLSIHKLIHTGTKPHKCNICDRSFVQSTHLKTHLRSHTDERPFVCLYCNRAFAQKYNLRVHTRIHTGETPYVCEICGSGFHGSGLLKKHMKTHILTVDKDNSDNTNEFE